MERRFKTVGVGCLPIPQIRDFIGRRLGHWVCCGSDTDRWGNTRLLFSTTPWWFIYSRGDWPPSVIRALKEAW